MNSKNNRGYMSNIDEMVEQTPLDLVLSHYGLPPAGNGNEYRMKCVFNEACSDSQYGNLSVKLDSAKRIYTHCCKVKGNLLTLLHGLETNQPPAGGRLRGQEFKNAVAKLKEINGVVDSPARTQVSRRETTTRQAPSTPEEKRLPHEEGSQDDSSRKEKPSFNINVPLRRHEKEAARVLANLNEDLVTDISQMSPEAAAYLRKRESWLTPELMKKWGVGWIPGNGRSLFRKNYIVYTHRNTRGDIVSYSGRDVNHEAKWQKWIKAGKPEGKKPNKHRYVSGFKRGAELYGGQASRLEEPYVKESLEQNGLVVVEGMNDVIRLDELGVCAVGICSNKATEQQIEMLTKFARQVANNRVMLFPDQDEEGKAGFKDLLWSLAERKLAVSLANPTDNDEYQPEDLKNWLC
jgi:5S rRNA maturation endonuclease (ribonuclease M5)